MSEIKHTKYLEGSEHDASCNCGFVENVCVEPIGMKASGTDVFGFKMSYTYFCKVCKQDLKLVYYGKDPKHVQYCESCFKEVK